MSEIQKSESQLTAKSLFARDDVKAKFQELLGKRAPQFMTSVLHIVNSSDLLKKAEPTSVYQCAALAATLDLPLNQNLGFAYIIPYNEKAKGDKPARVVAQFQIGYKGFIQLAQRSGQFKTISATPVYEGQLIEENPLTGFVFDWKQKKSDKVIGYAAYFQLLNGFEKTLYATVVELEAHGKKYSQSFKKNYGLWMDNFDSMATKTVLKLLLSKFAPLSIDMQRAVVTDQSIVNDFEAQDVTYIDNEVETVNPEVERITLMIGDAKTIEDLQALSKFITEENADIFTVKMDEFKAKSNG